MHLTKLKVYGFKSFQEKLSVDFNKGITAIIGPNGCGKTNVIDSIRWVFGEQRNKMLRSEKLEDLIFAGTAKRQPLNMAEVSLVINNEDKVLPTEYSEVMITRRIFRSGESEYRINKVPCRLKDINNLFMDTGLGSSAYSTIEGKMIDAILSEKPDERRFLFEEAAGISKYKRQRQDSLRQLEKTKHDLDRISDKVEETGRNVRILQRHVDKARRYKKNYTNLKDLEISYEKDSFDKEKQKVTEIRRQLDELEVKKAGVVAQRDTARLEVEQENLDVIEQEKKLQTAQESVNSITRMIQETESKYSLSLERIKNTESTIERLKNEIDGCENQITESSQLNTKIEKSLVEHLSQLEEGKDVLTERSERLSAFVNQLTEKRELAKQESSKQLEILGSISKNGNISTEIKAKIKHLENSLNEIHNEDLLLEKHIHDLEEEVSLTRAKFEIASEESKHLASSRDVLLQKIDAEDVKYHEIVEQEKELEARLIASRRQLDFLDSLNVTYEGYNTGTKSIMESRDSLPGIQGILADKINIKMPYVRAIESFLGQMAQTIVVDSISNALDAIKFLEEGHKGRASLLAMDKITEKTLVELPDELLKEEGVLARGTDCVDADPSILPIVHHLLDYVIIVSNRETADLLSRKWSNRRVWFVTLDGESHATNGTISGGRTGKTEMGLISRKQTIDKLKEEADSLVMEIKNVSALKTSCIETRNEARKALIEADERIDVGKRIVQEQESQLKHIDERIITATDRREEISINKSKFEADIISLSEDDKKITEDTQSLVKERADIEISISSINDELEESELQRKELEDSKRNKELEAEGLKNKVEQQRRDVERLKKEIETVEEKKIQMQKEYTASKDKLDELNELVSGAREKMQVLATERSEKAQERDVIKEKYTEMLNQIDSKRKTDKEFSGTLEKIQEDVHNLEIKIMNSESNARNKRDRIWELYNVDLESLPDDIQIVEWDKDTVKNDIARYKEIIKRIGQVNMAALEDYEVENKRYEELKNQSDDLLQAKESLEKAIKKLDRTAREQFLTTFKTVQKNFREVFVSLFEGGDAYVTLEPDKDPLEAGISINARPTGKKMQGVRRLSGGERALTAISLLFALYLTKPSPYCILDEIDAPLDDANIGRFIGLLKKFSEKTQFIIITHNKITMEASDTIYGVTMQERGVSKLVSVRFEEARAIAA